jgi:hypothetical protein
MQQCLSCQDYGDLAWMKCHSKWSWLDRLLAPLRPVIRLLVKLSIRALTE